MSKSVFVSADAEGRVLLIHNRPDLLSKEQIAQGHEFDAVPEQPAVSSHEQATLYLRDGVLVWDVQERQPTLDDALMLAARLAMTDKIASTTDAVRRQLGPLFPAFEPGITVAAGDVYSYSGHLVECVQAHTTQADWKPDSTPALWKVYRDSSAAPLPWKQPTGAHDAYQKDDRVTHSGQAWASTVESNVWGPGVYGWVKV